MYNRIYNGGGDDMRVPPDYGGSVIKPPAPIPPTPPPDSEKPEAQEEKCNEAAAPCQAPSEKSGGYLGNLLSKISADDLIIYGIIIYMTLQDSENDLLLLVLLLVVLM